MKRLIFLILLLSCFARADITRVDEEIRLPYWRENILSGDPNELDAYLRVFIKELEAVQDNMRSSINFGIDISDTDVRYFGTIDSEGDYANGDWRIIKLGSDDFEVQKLISDTWTQMSKWSEDGGFEYLTTLTDSDSGFAITSGSITGMVNASMSGSLTLSSLTASRLLSTNASSVITTTTGISSWITGTANQVVVTNDGDGTLTLSTPQDTDVGATPTFEELTLTGTNASSDLGIDIINLSGDADSSASLFLKTGTQTGFSIIKYGQAGTSGSLQHVTLINNADGDIVWKSATDSATGHYWTDADGGTNILEIDTASELVILPNLTTSRLVSTGSSSELASTDLNSWVTGTANQVTVTDDTDGTITLSTPQDTHSGASPTFTGLTLSGITDTHVLYSNATVLAGDATFNFNDTTKVLDVDGQTITGTTAIGLDMSGGTFATAVQKWPAGTISTAGTTVFQPAADSTTAYQWKNTGGVVVGTIDTTNKRWKFGPGAPSSTVHIDGEATAPSFIIDGSGAAGFPVEVKVSSSGNAILFTGGSGQFFVSGGAASFRALDDCRFHSGNKIEFWEDFTRVLAVIDTTTGFFGVAELSPETLLELTHATPYITLHNSTHEDSDGGRESVIQAFGEQGVSPFEETTLGKQIFAHDGSGADDKGYWQLYTNDGTDGDSPTLRIEVDSAGNTKMGDGATNYTNIAADGTLTLVGTATVWQSQDLKPANITRPQSDYPGETYYQNKSFDAYDDTTEEQLFYIWHLPNNFATGTASVRGHFGGMVANEGGAEYVAMGFEYWHFEDSDTYDISGAADGGGSVNITIVNAEGNYVWHPSATGDIDTTGWTDGITVFRFFRDVDGTYTGEIGEAEDDDYTGDVLIGVYHLEYLANKLGAAT